MIIIDYKDRRPIYEQIVDRFQELILKGVLEPDSQLPSVRNLAMDLSINPNTIQRAYGELERIGYIYTVKGRGSFIGDNTRLIQCRKEEMKEEIKRLLKEAHEIGLEVEELYELMNMVYKEGRSHDRSKEPM